jgi:hypothetical protein
VSALVTVLASRYYFQRSIKKSLGVYGILHSRVFSGITPDVRNQLQFKFGDRDVRELRLTVLLIANDGERSIRDVIDPLTLDLPPEVELLDASILHRHPSELDVAVKSSARGIGSPNVVVQFHLLNKGDFFVVKLLLSGALPSKVSQCRRFPLPSELKALVAPYHTLQDIEASQGADPSLDVEGAKPTSRS